MSESQSETQKPASGTVEPVGVVDVSNLATDDLSEVAQGTDVYLERRGSRTYMISTN
jgi:hypothetical protein